MQKGVVATTGVGLAQLPLLEVAPQSRAKMGFCTSTTPLLEVTLLQSEEMPRQFLMKVDEVVEGTKQSKSHTPRPTLVQDQRTLAAEMGSSTYASDKKDTTVTRVTSDRTTTTLLLTITDHLPNTNINHDPRRQLKRLQHHNPRPPEG